MAKSRSKFVCQKCGSTSPKWLGRCNSCGAWNSFVEEVTQGDAAKTGSLNNIRSELKSKSNFDDIGNILFLDTNVEESQTNSSTMQRYQTGLSELDRVLGGGLVTDSFVLIGGDPGIGKSTLLLQVAQGVVRAQPDKKVFYVSGEESVEQIRGRASRLGIQEGKKIFLAAETQLEKIIDLVKKSQPDVLIMDSLQVFTTAFVESAPGSVSQVREVAARLCAVAKTLGIAVWLVGHVTKEGTIAGPKVVEHIVDTVLSFEGEGGQNYRLLRAQKNRFGSVRELGVFEMIGEGLREITNPSELFLTKRAQPVAGTAIAAAIEGSRPLLVELQALVVDSALAMPRRTSVGLDASRLSLLSAVLERHVGISLSGQDLFFNVAGGLRLNEPACDLGSMAAIYSSFRNRAFPKDWIFIGEVGLTGEVRAVGQLELRLDEAFRLGFQVAVIPKVTHSSLKSSPIRLVPISKVSELPELVPIS